MATVGDISEIDSPTKLKELNRSIAECSQECAQDISSIGRQILDFMLERDRTRRSTNNEKLIDMVALFEQKLERMKALVEISPEYRERAEIISKLQKCVENRDGIIQRYADNLRGAEQVLTKGIYQANKKLKRIAEAEEHPVYSEEVLKFAHQISKSYSVAAPLFWQQGDPSRPFPTENEFRESTIAVPRPSQSIPSSSLTNIQGLSRSPIPPTRITSSSPANYGWSPRNALANQSPRARLAVQSGGTPNQSLQPPQLRVKEVSPYGERRHESSPRRSNRDSMGGGIPPVRPPEQMSSDSSSSSSSDDDA